MKKTISIYEFRDDFNKLRPNNFCYEGLTSIFNYFEDLENDLGYEIELDIIEICCDYTQFENLEEFQQEYSFNNYETIEEIEEVTQVIRVKNESFIIQNF